MSKVTYGRGYVYSIKYHIVWCTKYRHKVLVNKIDDKLKEIIESYKSLKRCKCQTTI